jgi:hypothetical protein
MHFVRGDKLYSHAPTCMRSQQFTKLFQSKFSLVDLNDYSAVRIDLDLTAQDRAFGDPLTTLSKILYLRRTQRHFVNHLLVFDGPLGVVSQTLIMYFNDIAVAHFGYFGTDFQTSDRDARFLILYPRAFAVSGHGHFVRGRNIADSWRPNWRYERSLEPPF